MNKFFRVPGPDRIENLTLVLGILSVAVIYGARWLEVGGCCLISSLRICV